MKYCLSNRQPTEWLNKADIIYMELRDHNSLPDVFEKYPDKEVILNVNTEWHDWELFKQYNILSQGKLIFCVQDILTEGQKCKDFEFRFYWGYPVQTFQDVKDLLAFGVEYIKLDAPLTFEMDKLKALGGKYIVVPNVAGYAYIPRETSSACCWWIRPEDLFLYEDYIDVIQFEDCEDQLEKERTLYHIYVENKEWPGKLNMLITNFNGDATNRLIYPEEMTKARMNCGQKCLSGSSCRICPRVMKLANEELIQMYRDFAEERRRNK